MPPPLPTPVKTFATLALVLVRAGRQAGPTPRPVPSVAQIGSNLKCASGEHGFEDSQAGWGFCYPGTWKSQEKAQSTQSPGPVELDLTFNITDIGVENSGLFAFMIISTFERGGSPNLRSEEHT